MCFNSDESGSLLLPSFERMVFPSYSRRLQSVLRHVEAILSANSTNTHRVRKLTVFYSFICHPCVGDNWVERKRHGREKIKGTKVDIR